MTPRELREAYRGWQRGDRWVVTASFARPETGHAEALTLAYSEGAAVAFGLMGMAEAIQERVAEKRNAELMSFVAPVPCEECGKPTSYDRAFCDACEWGDANVASPDKSADTP